MTTSMASVSASRPCAPPAGSLLSVALAGLLSGALTVSARAEQPVSLREALVGSSAVDGRTERHTPAVARYLSEGGAEFIFDRSGEIALLRFERSSEVWALRPNPAPGGDVVFKNDMGQPVVRATRFGGVTLFTPDRPGGAPAALVGEGEPSQAPSIGPGQLFKVLEAASARASRAAQRIIPFEAPNVSPGAEFLVADAAAVVSNTLVRFSVVKGGKAFLDKVRGVRIRLGKKVDARVKDGFVVVVVHPDDGIAGRPSSGRVAQALVRGE